MKTLKLFHVMRLYAIRKRGELSQCGHASHLLGEIAQQEQRFLRRYYFFRAVGPATLSAMHPSE